MEELWTRWKLAPQHADAPIGQLLFQRLTRLKDAKVAKLLITDTQFPLLLRLLTDRCVALTQ
jgi:hypothetical protein